MIYTLSLFNTGQITLPKKWRSRFSGDNFIAEIKNDRIIIKPLDVNNEKWVSVFDSVSDNNGKGVSIDDMISKLKDLQNG